MTQKEIENLKDKEYFEKGIVYGEGGCRSMIMSCLIYGTTKDYFMKKYASNYVKTKPKTGVFKDLAEVEKIWDDQENYFKNHCRVNHNVYTDSEGLSYNSITEF
jgi:hypothetical protein